MSKEAKALTEALEQILTELAAMPKHEFNYCINEHIRLSGKFNEKVNENLLDMYSTEFLRQT